MSATTFRNGLHITACPLKQKQKLATNYFLHNYVIREVPGVRFIESQSNKIVILVPRKCQYFRNSESP